MASMRTADTKLRKHVLCNPAVAKVTRLKVTHTHVTTTGEYGAGTWTGIRGTDAACHHRTVLDVYRMVNKSQRMAPAEAAKLNVKIQSDAEILRELEVMAPAHRVQIARPRLFTQILRRQDVPLLTLLVAGRKDPRSWLRLVFADLTWFGIIDPKLSELQRAKESTWVRRLIKYPTQTIASVTAALVKHAQVIVIPDEGSDAEVEDDGQVWTCGTCGAVKHSKQAYATHMAVRHNERRPARRKLPASTCPVCLRCYGGRSACLEHLYGSCGRVCHFNLMLFYPWLPDEEVEAADKAQSAIESAAIKRSECRRYTGILSAQCEGPLRKFLVPVDHPRRSHSKLFENMLLDEEATQCIDYDALEHLVYTNPSEAADEVPLALNPNLV